MQVCGQGLSSPSDSSSPIKYQLHMFFSHCPGFGWPTLDPFLKMGMQYEPSQTGTYTNLDVWVYRRTQVQMLAPSSRFCFQETSVLRKKTNGYLFNCYPQMRKYPSSSPHDDFPSKVSSRLELKPHTPLTLSLSICLSHFLSYCSPFTLAFTHTHTHSKHADTQA